MYSQPSQDGRQPIPGMHMQQQQGQVTNLGGQIQQMSNVMQVTPQQQPMTAMQGTNINVQGMNTRPVLVPQHSINAPGATQSMGIGGIRQPMTVIGQSPQQQQVGTVSGQAVQIQPQRMPALNQQQSQNQDAPTSQISTQDRIVKFKQLLPQLKECLVNLISIAQKNFAVNATIDNLDKTVDTSLVPRFDKALEQFYSICNQIELHLTLANDQIAQTLLCMQHVPIQASQVKDFTTYINTVKQQLAYTKEVQKMMTAISNNAQGQAPPGSAVGPRQY